MSEGDITVQEAAALTGYTARHIRRLCKEEVIKSHLVGKRIYLVNKASLLAYVAEMERGDNRMGPKG